MDERDAIKMAVDEIINVITDDPGAWWVSVIRNAITPEEITDEYRVKSRIALVKLGEVLNKYYQSNNLGKVEFNFNRRY